MSDQEAARTALRDFLTTRRGRITPGDVGMPSSGRRRVTGLRREEVAMLAGISPEYYTRLERGTAVGISAEIVDTVATALRLDGDERVHLDRLIAALTPAARRKRRPTKPETVSPGLQVMLEALHELPAVVFNGRLDIVAVNALGRALYDSHYAGPEPANAARFLFLHEDRARLFWPEWDKLAEDVVAILRVQAGLNPDDPALVELIGQLSTRSEQFRARWAANNVRAHRDGVKIFNHPLIGRVALPAETLTITAATDYTVTVSRRSPAAPNTTRCGSWPAGAPTTRPPQREPVSTRFDHPSTTSAHGLSRAVVRPYARTANFLPSLRTPRRKDRTPCATPTSAPSTSPASAWAP